MEYKSVNIADKVILNSDTLELGARTATATGATTGTIASTAKGIIEVTASDANHIIKLPAPVVGKKLALVVVANGFELRSSDPATIGINGGTGATAEFAVAAASIVYVECVSLTNWVAVNVIGGITGVDATAAA